MKRKRRAVSSYTEDELLEISLKYSNRTDFFNNERSAFRAATMLGYYNICTAHMVEKQKPKGHWTEVLCKAESIKFSSRFEFFKYGSAAYQAAQENGWLDEICSHMVTTRKKNGHWREGVNLLLEAMKYNIRKDFAKGSPGAYTAAQEMDVLDQVCFHMVRVGNAKNKIVYAWEFPDKSVYVGLTFNIEDRERHRNSCNTDAVTMYRKETRLTPTLVLKTKILPIEQAVKKEKSFVDQYSRAGWNVLNRMKPGAVGGNIITWTKPNCLKAAKKCKSPKQFYEQFASAYDSARKNKWLHECYSHMVLERKSYRHWTEQNIQKVALRCKTRTEFEEKYGSAFNAAMKKKILNKVCEHMAYLKMPNNYWTYQRVFDIAKNCVSIKDFISKHRNVYQAARVRKYLDKLYKDMKWPLNK